MARANQKNGLYQGDTVTLSVSSSGTSQRYKHRWLKKRLGQHFLTDMTVVEQILLCIGPQEKEHFIEIGPGDGALTQYILQGRPHITLDAFEIDPYWASQLTQRYVDFQNVHIHQQDALALRLSTVALPGQRTRLIGNLPYHISTPLLMHLCTQTAHIYDAHFMLQYEVACRMSATPQQKPYGRLSVIMQYYFDVTPLFDVPPHAFTPPPQVQSSVIRLMPTKRTLLSCAQTTFFHTLVQQAFRCPRKTIGKNLKAIGVDTPIWTQANMDPRQRPADFHVEDYMRLTTLLYKSH